LSTWNGTIARVGRIGVMARKACGSTTLRMLCP